MTARCWWLARILLKDKSIGEIVLPVGDQMERTDPSEFLLSNMKIAVVVRQLDRGHILWCGRVVRVKRAHRIRIVRGVQKMLDVGRHGVIEFGHILFVAHDHVVTCVFRKDEFVGCCVAHHSARDIESLGKVWRSRSMSPARVTQQRRQNRRVVWDDRARMGAAMERSQRAKCSSLV
jgi:hypothetical protein